MMKHYLDLAALSDRVHRRQSRMTRLCIVLAVFLVAVMFGLADMYLQGMVIETRQNTGDWHCKFTGLDRESAAFVASRPEVDFSGWQGTAASDAGCTLGGLPAALAGMDEALFARVYGGVFSDGRAPAAQEEIAVSDALAQAAGLTVGDRAALQGPGGTVYCPRRPDRQRPAAPRPCCCRPGPLQKPARPTQSGSMWCSSRRCAAWRT